MAASDLAEVVKGLTPEEQDCVRQFIDYLKTRGVPSKSTFLQAAEKFMNEHSELLQRLAQ